MEDRPLPGLREDATPRIGACNRLHAPSFPITCEAVNGVDTFAAKLTLALKALNLSRAQLAQVLGVDKSLVGRWASGAVKPSQHNLARLSTLIAERRPGFTMASWDSDISGVARLFGVNPASVASPDAVPGFPPTFLQEARTLSQERGGAYEAFWRTSRPSVLMRGKIFHDRGMIRLDQSGQLVVRMGGAGMFYEGVILPHDTNLYAIFNSPLVTQPYFLIAKAVTLPRAESIEGLLLYAALNSDHTPAAVPIILERIGDLSGDDEADDMECDRLIQSEPLARDDEIDPALRARLIRSLGPSDEMEEMFLTTGRGNWSSGSAAGGALRG